MRRALAEVRRIERAGSGQCLEAAVDGAAGEGRLGSSQLLGDLIGSAVAAKADNRFVHHRPLRGAPHSFNR